MNTNKLVAAIVLLAASSALPAGTAQRDSDRILAELRQIQAQLAELQTSQHALQRSVKELVEKSGSQESDVRKALADSTTVLKRVQEDISILSARVDETNGRLGNVRREISSLRQTQRPLVLPTPAEGEGEAEMESSGAEGGEEPAPTVFAAGPSVTDLYQEARLDYTQGRFPLAISGFEEVIENDPGGDLADNAYYWIGECFAAQRQYERAIEAFDTVIREYSDSNKVPDAYFKKASTLEALDRRSEAMKMYELIIQHFPRTQVERMSRRKLEQLMKTTRPQE